MQWTSLYIQAEGGYTNPAKRVKALRILVNLPMIKDHERNQIQHFFPERKEKPNAHGLMPERETVSNILSITENKTVYWIHGILIGGTSKQCWGDTGQ